MVKRSTAIISAVMAAASIFTASVMELTASAVYTPKQEFKFTMDDGIVYTYTKTDDGNGIWLKYSSGIKTTELEVPEEVDGFTVTGVGGGIIHKTNVTSVTLPESCKFVFGFKGCANLETIKINEGVTELESHCFENCTALKNVNLPEGLTEIPKAVFKGCTSLESVEIPSSVEKIGMSAFFGCTALKHLKLNEGLFAIGRSAFCDCGIQTLDLPSTLEKIEESAFLRNKPLKSLVVPSDIRVIGGAAFSHASIESINFEGEPEQIGEQAFTDNPLTKVDGLSRKSIIKFWKAFKKTPWQESMKDDSEPFLVDEDGRLVAYIGSSTDAEIPETVKTIGNNAFENSITSVKIPETVTQIEDAAFYGCDKLTEITIPASVTRIGQLAFSHCYRLKNITFEYSNESLQLDNCAFQFTLASPETLITNNRRYSNQKTAFQNTYFDPDYVPMMDNGKYVDESYTEPPKAKPQNTENPSAAPEVTAKPTERPKATEKPKTTEKPKATAKPISAPKPTEKPQVINVTPGESITVSVGDKEITFMDAQPFIDENGRTKIPIRAVAEGLGCKVDWDDATRTAVIKRGDDVVYIAIGKDTLQVGNTTVKMDTAAEIKDDRTYIPVRFVGEALGMQVNWNG